MPRHRYRKLKDIGIDAGGKYSSRRPPIICIDAVVPQVTAYGSFGGPIIKYTHMRLGCVRTIEDYQIARRKLKQMVKNGVIKSYSFVRVEAQSLGAKTWLSRADVARKTLRRGERFLRNNEWYELKTK